MSSTCYKGLTVPLMVTEHGEKLGKSAGNAIWLNSSKDALRKYFKTFGDGELLDLLLQLTCVEPGQDTV